jgi:hypothetical protein
MSLLNVNAVEPSTGTDITLGASGDTITVPSGATIVNSGTATGFGAALTGSTNNTVTTVTAANAIQGEANLQFDGTDLTVSTGNVVIGTSGKGIDFSATSGTGTSELLDDYEEGAWTPACPNVTVTGSEGKYTKVGRLVTVQGYLTWPTTSDTNDIEISGLPFTINNSESGRGGAYITYTTFGASFLVNGDGFYLLGQKNDTYFFASAADGNTSQDNNEVSTKQCYINGQFYTDS